MLATFVLVAGLLSAMLPGAVAGAAPTGIRSTHDVAVQVGRLSAQLTKADADLRQASTTASTAIEHYERAVVDADRAERALRAARNHTRSATVRVRRQHAQVGAMVRNNYELGGTIGATAALVSGSPADALRNIALLTYTGDRQARILRGYQRARALAVLAEGTARSSWSVQVAARRKAAAARQAAQRAVALRQGQIRSLRAKRADLQRQLDQITAHNTAVRRAAAAAARRRAAAASADHRRADVATADASRGSARGSGHASNRAMVAVHAALAQLGKRYVWAAADPAVGFDCSGLALYAYRQIGIELPHSAEYQYLRGTHVTGSLRPGDLLFYSSNGQVSGIHHVTMYIGRGQVVQAADFGIPIQVVAAYFNYGYIGATRLA